MTHSATTEQALAGVAALIRAVNGIPACGHRHCQVPPWMHTPRRTF